MKHQQCSSATCGPDTICFAARQGRQFHRARGKAAVTLRNRNPGRFSIPKPKSRPLPLHDHAIEAADKRLARNRRVSLVAHVGRRREQNRRVAKLVGRKIQYPTVLLQPPMPTPNSIGPAAATTHTPPSAHSMPLEQPLEKQAGMAAKPSRRQPRTTRPRLSMKGTASVFPLRESPANHQMRPGGLKKWKNRWRCGRLVRHARKATPTGEAPLDSRTQTHAEKANQTFLNEGTNDSLGAATSRRSIPSRSGTDVDGRHRGPVRARKLVGGRVDNRPIDQTQPTMLTASYATLNIRRVDPKRDPEQGLQWPGHRRAHIDRGATGEDSFPKIRHETP